MDEEVKLIEMVRVRRNLFDPKHHQYEDLYIRNVSWLEISRALNQSVNECQLRWRQLQEAHLNRNRIMKLQEGSPNLAKKMKKCYMEHLLEFLDEPDIEREALKNIGLLKNNENVDCENPQIKSVEREIKPADKENGSETGPFIVDFNIDKKPKELRAAKGARSDYYKRERLDEKILKIVEEVCEQMTIHLAKKQEPDEIDLFFNSMAMSVKNMTLGNYLKAKIDICDVVCDLEKEESAKQGSG